MSKQIEALKLALEALEFMNHVDSIFEGEFNFQINAIKEALAQPEQEPVYPWFMKWNKCADFWAHYMCINEKAQEDRAYEAKRWIERMRQASELKPQPEKVAEHADGTITVRVPPQDLKPVAWRAWVPKFPVGTGNDWVYVTNPIMKDRIHNEPLYTKEQL